MGNQPLQLRVHMLKDSNGVVPYFGHHSRPQTHTLDWFIAAKEQTIGIRSQQRGKPEQFIRRFMYDSTQVEIVQDPTKLAVRIYKEPDAEISLVDDTRARYVQHLITLLLTGDCHAYFTASRTNSKARDILTFSPTSPQKELYIPWKYKEIIQTG